MVEPVIIAIASVMSWRPQWPECGLAWIEAFDSIPLLVIVEVMRDLDLFKEQSIARYLSMIIHNKLMRVLDPPPEPKPARKPYVYRCGPRKPKVGRALA